MFAESLAVLETADKCISHSMAKPSPIQGDFVRDMAAHLAASALHPSLAQSAAHTSWVMDEILQNY